MANVKVVFATITGNNEDVADIIAEALKTKELQLTLKKFHKLMLLT